MTPGIGAPVLVGRTKELDELAHALADPPAVVLIEGEAGIGKTRLVREFLASSDRIDRQHTLMAICPPFLESPTLGPIIDAVRRSRGSVRELRLSALAGALRPIFPEWAADLPPAPEPLDDPGAARHRLFRALAEIIERLGVELLVLEDAHWSDQGTLEFLLALCADEARPVSMLVTSRPEDVPDGSALLRLSSRPGGRARLHRITLGPLDVADTGEFVSSMLRGEPVSTEFAEFVHEHTEGLPLAVEESVRLLHNREDLIQHDGHWIRRGLAEFQVPPTVRDSVLERVYRLREVAQLALRAAAVLDQPADESTVAALAGLPADQAAAGLTEAAGVGLLVEEDPGRLTFRHALMRSAVYASIAALERRQLHLAAGRLLMEVEPQPAAELTHHFRLANAAAEWARYAEVAADQAMAAHDHASACATLDAVLTAGVADPRTRTRLALLLGTAVMFDSDDRHGKRHRTTQTLEAVIESPGLTRADRARVRTALARVRLRIGDFADGRADLERAWPDLASEPAEAAKVLTWLGLPFVGRDPAEAHRRYLRRAGALTAKVESAETRLSLTIDQAMGFATLGEEDGWRLAETIPRDGLNPEERHQLARGWANLASAAIMWGRYDAARQFIAGATALADADDLWRVRRFLDVSSAELEWRTAAWPALTRRLEAIGSDAEIVPESWPVFSAYDARLIAARGDRRRAADKLAWVLQRERERGLIYNEVVLCSDLGRLRLADDDPTGALAATEPAHEVLMSKGIWVWATEFAPVRVDALVGAGRAADADRLVAVFERGLRGRELPGPHAALVTCRALLAAARGDHRDAAKAFAEAAQRWDLLPRPYDALAARQRAASSMIHHGDTENGVAQLTEVHRGFDALGAADDAQRVVEQLREHGVRSAWRGGRRGYGDRLSPSELAVVRLVAAGQTNRMIADALSKSPKTVAMQVKSAMRKLDAANRTELAVRAVAIGAVDENPASS